MDALKLQLDEIDQAIRGAINVGCATASPSILLGLGKLLELLGFIRDFLVQPAKDCGPCQLHGGGPTDEGSSCVSH